VNHFGVIPLALMMGMNQLHNQTRINQKQIFSATSMIKNPIISLV
jgi:hypothetical protein